MVFYYTATGNSLYVAKKLSENPISIPQVMKRDDLIFENQTIGIVCPVYTGEMPALVEEFLKKATFKTDYFFWVSTYGNDDTVYAEYAYKKCKENGIDLAYTASVKMVDNFLPVFDIEQQLSIDKNEDEQIYLIKAEIAARKRSIKSASVRQRGLYAMVRGMQKANPAMISPKSFTVIDDCIGCGICEKVCPRGNVTVDGGKPSYGEACDFCLGCVNACPQKAIELVREANPNARYRKSGITLEEIIAANNQH
jgi:ferredoxin